MTRADRYLAAGILLIAILSVAIFYFRSSLSSGKASSVGAVISAQGEIVRKIDLSPGGGKTTFLVSGRLGPATVAVEGRRIRVLDAPCPERICVKQGWIENPGESIVCIPGETVIHIEGAAPVDAVTR